jgi:hypothetical protein
VKVDRTGCPTLGKDQHYKAAAWPTHGWMPALQPGLRILSHESKPVMLTRIIGASLIKKKVSEYDYRISLEKSTKKQQK